jgi:hypothetical protein
MGHEAVLLYIKILDSTNWTKGNHPKRGGYRCDDICLCSSEFGFGLTLSQQQLQKVNKARQATKSSDQEAEKEIRGNFYKDPLDNSPFVLKFKYGANNQGYWKYDHMVLQIENCIDVLKNLWLQLDYVFLFDHSCGHDRRRPGGRTTKSLNKGFGGTQTNMKELKIEADNEDTIGPHATKLTLKLGDIQSMQFSSTDDGPCWMSPAQRLATKKN